VREYIFEEDPKGRDHRAYVTSFVFHADANRWTDSAAGKRIGAPAHWVAAWRSRATLIPPPDVLDRIQEIIWEWHALYKEVKSLSRQIYGEDAEKWLHSSLPALGNRSPHQLRKTSSGLKRVLDLLKKSPSTRDHL
jgi:Protein of unknown function (DUF2384)